MNANKGFSVSATSYFKFESGKAARNRHSILIWSLTNKLLLGGYICPFWMLFRLLCLEAILLNSSRKKTFYYNVLCQYLPLLLMLTLLTLYRHYTYITNVNFSFQNSIVSTYWNLGFLIRAVSDNIILWTKWIFSLVDV